MPMYIDFHAKMPSLPKEALDGVRQQLGKSDPEGAKLLEVMFTNDGQAYCLTDAPSVDAVCRSHEAKGLPIGKGDVHEVATRIG